MRSLLRLLFVATAFLLGGGAVRAQVTFTFTGTAGSNDLGYTAAQTGTFVITMGTSFVQNGSEFFFNDSTNGHANYWIEDTTSHSQLFNAVSGASLTGVFVRPTSASTDPNSVLTTSNGNHLQITIGNDNAAGNIGPTLPNSTQLKSLYVDLTLSSTIFTSPGAYTDPAAYFAGLAGSYSGFSAGYIQLTDPANNTVGFTLTNLTISSSAIPEPATNATLLALTALGVWAVRRRAKRPA
jgi:hypothetical protein